MVTIVAKIGFAGSGRGGSQPTSCTKLVYMHHSTP